MSAFAALRRLALTGFLAAALAGVACGGGEAATEAAPEGVDGVPEVMAEHPVTSPAAMAAGIVDDDGTHGAEAGDAEPADAGPAASTPSAGAG